MHTYRHVQVHDSGIQPCQTKALSPDSAVIDGIRKVCIICVFSLSFYQAELASEQINDIHIKIN